MQENTTENLKQKIMHYEKICMESLEMYQSLRPYDLSEIDMEKIKSFIKRLIDAEMEYLNSEPDMYHQLYGDIL
jgi:hypothetical protein